ncbi:enoyl-CoA hydratase/isomerase family protein [Streptomyces sp. WI04-05B]|uniref:enoyl-CoA hydratase/isomerase family protein n=1 Tax=Streptomyces TaxID=1883 RepID=UPI0029BC7CBD|nr:MULTISPECIES: enoyl-CoA hydratase/isomerase family protein [unclassified Streptomyces]MDX2541473.1 enoyl-CoA hydratase/isomerase family protein [Streptomyces sp. WI04-05B]MDX2583793.1 enoyl-CoA hydratase/isomerase family protein [Streptomyces sp. WI04-05A]MDX3745576.1 enoyl-CoA hydratase/isomerase family protein [Streptomyces sp. AK08-02]
MLRVELRDQIAVLTLDRPERLNAVGTGIVERLTWALHDLRDNDDVRAVVLAGAGRAFSAGADIGEIESCTAPGQFRAFVGRLTDAYALLENFPKPSVAAVHGFAYGGGLELALACDLRVAERGTRLGLPEMKLGVLPGAGGTQRLPRLLPPAIAKQMILTGEPIDAERAWQLGLVNELAEPGGALAAAEKLAVGLAAGAPLALAAGKRLIDHGLGMDLETAIAYERETVTVLFSTEDRAEGLKAFRDRRPGEFRGV